MLTFLPRWALMINTFSEWTAWCGTEIFGSRGAFVSTLVVCTNGCMLVGSCWKFEGEIILKIGVPWMISFFKVKVVFFGGRVRAESPQQSAVCWKLEFQHKYHRNLVPFLVSNNCKHFRCSSIFPRIFRYFAAFGLQLVCETTRQLFQPSRHGRPHHPSYRGGGFVNAPWMRWSWWPLHGWRNALNVMMRWQILWNNVYLGHPGEMVDRVNHRPLFCTTWLDVPGWVYHQFPPKSRIWDQKADGW